MATLSINDFLGLKKVKVELRRINVFIGPQAQGKSVISKLIYFFKELPSSILDSSMERKDKRQFDSACKERFLSIFPLYAWEKTPFLITYDCDGYTVTVQNLKVGVNKFKFCFVYTEAVSKALVAGRKAAKGSTYFDEDLNMSTRISPVLREQVWKAVANTLLKGASDKKIAHLIYIPAGRSFFANLQKNIFSFISTNTPIDYFLKEFGSVYERTRVEGFQQQARRIRPKNIIKIVDDLLCGTYLSEKGQDWIVGGNGKVSVSNSSSGQQEVLPMAMVLSTWPFINSSFFQRSFIIEEPEAHLFPIAQGRVVSLIAEAYNSRGSGDFVVTTHSPYILTALNNLIQASNAWNALPAERKSEIYKLVPKSEMVDFDDVSAYMVDKGGVHSILDREFSLIQADAIDAVSAHFSDKFEKLLELEMSGIDNEDLI
ncbi:hypothetical protein CJU79_20040 [Pseudomonas fragi]|uniref:AAA family ATPase n=1 Tax=Pseudomonas fragi TaxID=296 RepID=UPI000BA28A9D|nr:AAA family ATPase [Pseudomonas fragi]PAA35321.1 hypothetical protein CJU79_20040 [Pseudomonas fragi]